MEIYIGTIFILALIDISLLMIKLMKYLKLKKDENEFMISLHPLCVIPCTIGTIFVSTVLIILKITLFKEDIFFSVFTFIFFLNWIIISLRFLNRKVIVRDRDIMIVNFFKKQKYHISEIHSLKQDAFGIDWILYDKEKKRVFTLKSIMINKRRFEDYLKENDVEVG